MKTTAAILATQATAFISIATSNSLTRSLTILTVCAVLSPIPALIHDRETS